MIFFGLCGALIAIISTYCYFDNRSNQRLQRLKEIATRDTVLRKRLDDWEHLEQMMIRIVNATFDPEKRQETMKQFYLDNPPPRLEE